jgi:16S rRNA (uracil1498-N3)-methyltransferase
MKRVYAPPDSLTGNTLIFSEKTAHYVKNVLRLKEGDRLLVFDGTVEREARLRFASAGRLEGAIAETPRPEPRATPVLTLAFGLVRPGPVQEILRHCTELGVDRFVLLTTRRTVRNPREAKDRWTSIVISASAQCGRADLPEVLGPLRLHDFLDSCADDHARVLLCKSPHAEPLLMVVDSLKNCSEWRLCVGPEGGFTEEELEAMTAAGFIHASLGSRTLRSETAAIAAVGTLVAGALR